MVYGTTYETIKFDLEDKIATIWFNRPHIQNAWSPEVTSELTDLLRRVAGDSEARVLILTGAGDKAFSSGAYLKEEEVHKAHSAGDFVNSYLTEFNTHPPFDIVESFPKPIIAAINGYAFGIGFIVALCCDILIASENATMGLPQVSLGLLPAYGGAYRLARFVGKGNAMSMVLLSERIDAKEAYRIGVVKKVLPQGELMKEARGIASKLASYPPLGLRFAKESLNLGMDIPLHHASIADVTRMYLLQTSKDAEEAHRAWREKRKPEFQGK
jgi:enoyl-CoA hydratase/carnithine racemase